MTKIITSNSMNYEYSMNRRGKTKNRTEVNSGESSVTTNNVDQETADRIAAAEAMSCLSSLVFLPSNSEDLNSINYDIEIKQEPTETRNNSHAQDLQQKTPKRGKSKTRGRKVKNETTSSATHTYQVQSVLAKGTSSKSPQSRKGKSRAHKNINNNKSVSQSVTPTSQQMKNANTTSVKAEPIVINALSKNLVRESLQQMLESRRQVVESTPSSVSNSVLKLPLALSEKVQPVRETCSPKSVASNDSIELTQSTVDSIFSSNKYDTPETSLPLKKRRLLGYQESTLVEQGSDEKVVNLFNAETELQDEKTESMDVNSEATDAKSTDVAMRVDPRTSLMLLMEVQVAIEPDEDGDLPLHIAVVHENIVMVQKFVHLMTISGKSVDKYNKSQQTPLHLAIELQFEQAVSVLLQAGANPNLVNRHGENAVHMAVKCDAGSCVLLMLNKSQHKIDLNARNVEGLTPLHVAVMRNQIEIVKLLIKNKADINIQDGKSGRTPLFHAVEANLIPIVDVFQYCGANIDLTNYAGITAVMAAQARGYQEAASILLRGLDAKSYLEHKEREKTIIPSKKVPIPRIPSKSHLIVVKQNRFGKLDQNNSDSNDSTGNPRSESLSQPQTVKIQQVDSDMPYDNSQSTDNRGQALPHQTIELKVDNKSEEKLNNHLVKNANTSLGSGIYYSVSNKSPVPSTSSKSSAGQATLGKITNINVSTASLLAAHLQKLLAKGNSAGSSPLNLTTVKSDSESGRSSSKED